MKMKIDHIGIAVKNLEKSLDRWTKLLHKKERGVEELTERKIKLAFLDLEEGPSVELITPFGEGSHIEKFLDERGEGIHHFCFEIEDIEEAIEELKGKGIEFIQESPQKGAEGSLIAFIHPHNFNGVLLELKEKST